MNLKLMRYLNPEIVIKELLRVGKKAIKSIERALKFYPSFKSGEMIPKIERLIREESI